MHDDDTAVTAGGPDHHVRSRCAETHLALNRLRQLHGFLRLQVAADAAVQDGPAGAQGRKVSAQREVAVLKRQSRAERLQGPTTGVKA